MLLSFILINDNQSMIKSLRSQFMQHAELKVSLSSETFMLTLPWAFQRNCSSVELQKKKVIKNRTAAETLQRQATIKLFKVSVIFKYNSVHSGNNPLITNRQEQVNSHTHGHATKSVPFSWSMVDGGGGGCNRRKKQRWGGRKQTGRKRKLETFIELLAVWSMQTQTD